MEETIESAGAKPLLIISGPTAGGKSALALELAGRLRGEIVNIDSVQVFRRADIGSAKASASEREKVPHHLIDIADPCEPFNLSRYLAAAKHAVADIVSRGGQPIFCGGTTMYITALLHGLADLPAADPELRMELEGMANQALRARLESADARAAARIHVNDRLRTIRAIEAAEHGFAGSVAKHGFKSNPHRALILVVCWPRQDLYDRINARTRNMMERGLVEECRALFREAGAGSQVFRALGYSQVLEFEAGSGGPDDLAARIAMGTRRFAKRQMTYWRNEPPKRGWKQSPPQQAGRDPRGGPVDLQSLKTALVELVPAVSDWLRSPGPVNEVWYLDGASLGL